MKIIQGTRTLSAPFQSSVLTIGNFDGVHLGHQALVGRVVARAREKNVPSIVMTFDPHPVQVLYPDRKLHRIFDSQDQVEMLESLGVDYLVIEPFSREFSQLAPERYLLEWIFRPFDPETLVVGYDFSFGANRQGSIDFLKSHAETLGFNVEVVPPVKVGEVLVSSSRIRQAILAGDVKLAKDLLGRSFYINGLVEKGAGRGRKIGVPTANLKSTAETVPSRGVYSAWAKVREQKFMAAVNIGYNPTFIETSLQHPSIEAHLIDFGNTPATSGAKSDLYGESIRLEFVSRLREEKKFNSVEDLIAQIRRDIETSRSVLSAEDKK